MAPILLLELELALLPSDVLLGTFVLHLITLLNNQVQQGIHQGVHQVGGSAVSTGPLLSDQFRRLAWGEVGWGQDGTRRRHWPVSKVDIRAAEVVCMHLNRSKLI